MATAAAERPAPSLTSLLAKIRKQTEKARALRVAIEHAGDPAANVSEPQALVDPELEFRAPSLYQRATDVVNLIPVAATVAVTTWLVARRELRTLWLLLGLVVQTVVCSGLKAALQSPRPESAARLHGLHDFGMPSEHTSLVAFVAGHLLLHAAVRPLGRRLFGALAVLGMVAAVAVNDERLGVVSAQQAAGGVGLGLGSSLLWNGLLWRALRRPLHGALVESAAGTWAYLRDSSRMPDAMQREYEWYRGLLRGKCV